MKHLIAALLFALLSCPAYTQNIGIGTINPHTSAALDITSTSKGLLLPRLTTSQRVLIPSPADGLLSYDSTEKRLYLYKNTSGWKPADFELPYYSSDNSSSSFSISNPGFSSARVISGFIGVYLPPELPSAAVYGGTNINGYGVFGGATSANGTGVGGTGYGVFATGVRGSSTSGIGVWGSSTDSTAIYGKGKIGMKASANTNGLYGLEADHPGNGTAAHFFSNSSISNEQLLIEETENDYARIKLKNNTVTGHWTLAALNNVNAVNDRFHIFNSTAGNIISLTGAGMVGIGTGDPSARLQVDHSSSGAGILARNSSTSGITAGIKGVAQSVSDTTAGIWGEVSTSSISLNTKAYGVLGIGDIQGSSGVLGIAKPGGSYGVQGVASNIGVFGSATFWGVFGESYNGTGSSAGVEGRTMINGGVGIIGNAQNFSNARGIKAFAGGAGSIGIDVVAQGSSLYALSATSISGTAGYFAANSNGGVEQILIQETENDFARIKFRNTNAPFWVIGPYASATGNASAARFNIFYSNLNNGAGADAFVMDGNGNLTIAGNAFKPGGGAWNVPSDLRLKKNISDFTDGLNVVQQIRPVRFQYNGLTNLPADPHYIGVLAQELQGIAPYMVDSMKQTPEGYLQVDPNAFTYLLINAVKELHHQNQILQQQNSRLSTDIEQIKKRLGLN